MVARKYLTRFGEIRFAANAERYKIAHEATAGIKDVKLLGLEARYLRRFQIPARRLARVDADPRGDRPGAALPAAGGGLRRHAPDHPRDAARRGSASLGAILPLLAVYAFAGLRLLAGGAADLRSRSPRCATTSRRWSRCTRTSWRSAPAARAAGRDRATSRVHLRERLELVDVHYLLPAGRARRRSTA